MKLSPQEKAARKAAFRAMTPAKKAEHIYIYYKWPILLALAVLLALGSGLYQRLTRKEPVVYAAVANVAVGADLERAMTGDVLPAMGADPRRQTVYLYKDLYLSDQADTLNHEYAYASRMKLMGAVQAQKLDVAVMNREAYDLLSAGGYLLDLSALAEQGDPAAWEALSAHMVSNAVTVEDNSIEYTLGEAEEHRVLTETVPNALELTAFPLFAAAGFPESVYVGRAEAYILALTLSPESP